MAFLKKEFKAIFKTYRIWVVPAIFLFFALMGAPLAKLTPEIIKAAQTPGMTIKVPPPTILDALAQWTKNLTQIGVLAVILLSMGVVSEERAKNTLQLVLTKPVSRTSFILSKLFAQESLVIGSLLVMAPIAYLYSILLFEGDKLKVFAQANAVFFVYYMMIVAITVAFSCVFDSAIAAGGLSILAFAVLSIIPVLGKTMAKYSPGALPGIANDVLLGKVSVSSSYWPMVVAVVVGAIAMGIAILVFKRQEL